MYPFFESIAIVSGKPRNLLYHQARIDKTFKHFYPKQDSHHLEYLISKIKLMDVPMVKCKFSYNESSFKFFQLVYQFKKYTKFLLIENNGLEYSFKYTDRIALEKPAKLHSTETQFIYIKNDVITDSGFSNLVFFDGFRWLTPNRPLLEGTMRASLLAELKIYEESISTHHFPLFKSFKLINALNSLEDSMEYSMDFIKPDILKY